MKNALRGLIALLAVATITVGVSAQRGGRRDAGAANGRARDAGAAEAGVNDGGEHAEWHELGEAMVDGARDRDTIQVARAHNPLTKLLIRVDQSDLELFDMNITFADGTTFAPRLRLTFREGDRSRQIDLPGAARVVRRVDFRYGNLPGGGRAHLELLGR
jgi:hypothetical protein